MQEGAFPSLPRRNLPALLQQCHLAIEILQDVLEVQGTLSEMIVFLSPVFVPDAEVQACATFDFNRLLFVPLHDVARIGDRLCGKRLVLLVAGLDPTIGVGRPIHPIRISQVLGGENRHLDGVLLFDLRWRGSCCIAFHPVARIAGGPGLPRVGWNQIAGGVGEAELQAPQETIIQHHLLLDEELLIDFQNPRLALGKFLIFQFVVALQQLAHGIDGGFMSNNQDALAHLEHWCNVVTQERQHTIEDIPHGLGPRLKRLRDSPVQRILHRMLNIAVLQRRRRILRPILQVLLVVALLQVFFTSALQLPPVPVVEAIGLVLRDGQILALHQGSPCSVNGLLLHGSEDCVKLDAALGHQFARLLCLLDAFWAESILTPAHFLRPLRL
mmetsp:Transcript_37269/g.58900  ORF Transcript_37269/g.58900 Transcript_37269/m.58900 type:complete len:385 (+) Transcript_37269:92-1246(+)